VQVAQSNNDLINDLFKAVVLTSVLSGPGPFTVFAPTNQAFQDLGPALNQLFLPENQQELIDVLTYHVAPSAIYSTQIVNKEVVPTVEGSSLTARLTSNSITHKLSLLMLLSQTAWSTS
jgi:uncharacterized surface protein with fasciclin (FAS1) repeats